MVVAASREKTLAAPLCDWITITTTTTPRDCSEPRPSAAAVVTLSRDSARVVSISNEPTHRDA